VTDINWLDQECEALDPATGYRKKLTYRDYFAARREAWLDRYPEFRDALKAAGG
jgi:hypothetical protein